MVAVSLVAIATRVFKPSHPDPLAMALLQIVGGDKLIIPFC